MNARLYAPSLVSAVLTAVAAAAEPRAPLDLARALEARMASGDGITLPDALVDVARHAGTIDLDEGAWPQAFLARRGETIAVAVSPTTGNYEFFDADGRVFWTLVPAVPTTENWVAPFRRASAAFPTCDADAPAMPTSFSGFARTFSIWPMSCANAGAARSAEAANAAVRCLFMVLSP